MKELTGRTSEGTAKDHLEEGQMKFHNLKEVGRRSMEKQRNKVSLSLSHWVSKGRLKNYRRQWSNPSLTPKEARREKGRKRSRRRKPGGPRRRMRGE